MPFSDLNPLQFWQLVGVRRPPIEFEYVNWRNERHHYVIECEAVEFGPYDEEGKHDGKGLRDWNWVLHGYLFNRDGDIRAELVEPADRRRTFLIKNLENTTEH